MIIRARAPFRISFAGGGTDVAPYPAKHGGVVLTTSIDQYAYCTVEDALRDEYSLDSADLEIKEIYQDLDRITYDGRLDLAKAVVKTLCSDQSKKFQLSLFSEAPVGSGLGSSSSLMVSIIKAVSDYLGLGLDRYSLAEMAYQLERIELAIKGGYQDQYASVFGGFNFIEFSRDKTMVNSLRISQEILQELRASLVLIDTGRSRLSSDILTRQIKSYETEDGDAMENLDAIKKIAYAMKSLLLKGNLTEFGTLLTQEWNHKKHLDKMISNDEIDRIYTGALENGAIGGKVLGAGNGGHMLFFVNLSKKKGLMKYFYSKAYKPVPFNFEPEGVVSWRLKNGEVLT